MIIRVLDSLDSRQQWIEFCRREQPYCFVRQPDTLVDFQTRHLTITLLNQQVRHGQQAIKYSIGSRRSIAPAWHFIKACGFDLQRMINLLQDQAFDSNARDNALRGLRPDTTVRKFFAKERALISPAFLGPLEPLDTPPPFWDIHSACRLLANRQFRELRCDSPDQPDSAAARDIADPQALLLSLVEATDRWHIECRPPRVYIVKDRRHRYSLEPLFQMSRAETPRLPRQAPDRKYISPLKLPV